MGHATPTAERAYEHVKDLILDGTYGSGGVEVGLAQALRVALARLRPRLRLRLSAARRPPRRP
ncbi:hypothetical protein Sgou_49020 [Streptomyces gougerotii]|uniref:Uncharacterized protein n=1 Tax=Streptomyces gougerotii TaxID=53448 RepID=A0A8H9LTK1_9ACTN|nr:hypothetical protein Sgou_49020 [Streptomyces gougerotii]GGU77801.1 hypothetical protein GCM10010227_34990 [Streptomyces gougerotii]